MLIHHLDITEVQDLKSLLESCPKLGSFYNHKLMKHNIITFNEKLKSKKNSHLFLLFFISFILYKIISAVIVNAFAEDSFEHLSADNINSPFDLFVKFFSIVVIAPFFETVIFQVLPIETMIKFKAKPLLAVLLSSVIFALAHSYNIVYIITVFPLGFVYCYYYYLLRYKDKYLAFLSVVGLHAASNLFAYVNNFILIPLVN